MADREDLIALLVSWDLGVPQSLEEDASLIRSGILDSIRLLDLIEWVEQRIGRPVDPAEFDLANEFDTVHDIVGFVEQHRSGGDGASG